jgi:hypothetical protein
MPRPKRYEFKGAIHLVTLTGHSGQNVFYDPTILEQFPQNPRAHAPDAAYFEGLLWDVCEQYDASIHAYIVESNASLIVVQTFGAPLAWLIHDLLARYSRRLHECRSTLRTERPFPRRYKAQIVQPTKLPYVVRHVQRRNVISVRPRRALNHPFSSNLIYCGRRPRPKYFVLNAMRDSLAPLGHIGPDAYFAFMATNDSPSIAHMLCQQVIGERSYADSLRALCRRHSEVPSPDDVLREVTVTLLHSAPELARSSTHVGALARALVAWYAMRTGIAQIGAVARWFGVTSSDLRYLIRRHRQINPQYFSKCLFELFPILAEGEARPRSHDAVQFPAAAQPPRGVYTAMGS